jgi:hypothetical protein
MKISKEKLELIRHVFDPETVSECGIKLRDVLVEYDMTPVESLFVLGVIQEQILESFVALILDQSAKIEQAKKKKSQEKPPKEKKDEFSN